MCKPVRLSRVTLVHKPTSRRATHSHACKVHDATRWYTLVGRWQVAGGREPGVPGRGRRVLVSYSTSAGHGARNPTDWTTVLAVGVGLQHPHARESLAF